MVEMAESGVYRESKSALGAKTGISGKMIEQYLKRFCEVGLAARDEKSGGPNHYLLTRQLQLPPPKRRRKRSYRPPME